MREKLLPQAGRYTLLVRPLKQQEENGKLTLSARVILDRLLLPADLFLAGMAVKDLYKRLGRPKLDKTAISNLQFLSGLSYIF